MLTRAIKRYLVIVIALLYVVGILVVDVLSVCQIPIFSNPIGTKKLLVPILLLVQVLLGVIYLEEGKGMVHHHVKKMKWACHNVESLSKCRVILSAVKNLNA